MTSPLPHAGRRATLRAIVHNPASGARPDGRLAERVARELEREGEIVLLPTARAGHAVELVESLLRSRPGELTDVFALGGDGTLNEALLGAWRAGCFEPGGPAVRAAVLPGGSTNVVARSLGLPRDPVRAAAALAAGGSARLDLGVCRLTSGERPFLLACGIGFDAEVARDVSPVLKRWLRRHSYFVSALGATGESERGIVAEWERPDGTRGSREAASVIIGNCALYAGVVKLRREASFQDGLLDLALLSSTRLIPLLTAGITGIVSELAAATSVQVEAARSVRVRARDGVAVHVDAEPIGSAPAEVEVRPAALDFRVPSPL